MKKLLSVLLVFVLLVSIVPLGAFSLTVSAMIDGYYTYTITADGKATITGVDTSINGDITIPATLGEYKVTSIGEYAFNHTAITSVTIPDSVKNIGDEAFSGCENLTSVTMSDSVTSIGNYVFAFCENLTSITLPDSVTSIGWAVFYNSGYYDDDSNWIDNALYCGNHLIAVNDLISGNYTVKTNIKTIAADAFWTCNLLTSISVDKNNNNYSSIDGVLFNKNATIIIQYPCGKTDASYTIPNSVISIGDNAFLGSELIDITVPDSVKNIGGEAFSYCINLTTIRLGCNVMNIGYFAFSDCYGLTSITIPDSVTSIGYSAFGDCESLENVYYGGSEQDRENIKIGDENGELANATWHYNYGRITYPDVAQNAWYTEAVEYVSENGIMTGYGGTNLFGTADKIQRQDFVVILARLAGVDLENYQSNRASFADVPSGTYYENAILWAADCGITTGYNDGTNRFGVGDKVTREQLVTFLYRYAKYINGGVAPTVSAGAEQKAKTYADYKGVTDYAKEAIIWALDKSVISGQGGTRIAPAGNALRCEVAQIMYNIFLNNIF